MTAPQTAYDGDPRVVVFGAGHLGVYLPSDDPRNGTPSGDVRPRPEDWFAAHAGGEQRGSFRSIDDAIHALIGDPIDVTT